MNLRTEEKLHLGAFLEGLFPNEVYQVSWGHSDPPDMVVKVNDKLIGIEHTELVHSKDGPNGDLAAQDRHRMHVMNTARKNFIAISDEIVYVEATINSTLGKHNVNSIAIQLAEIILQNLPEFGVYDFFGRTELIDSAIGYRRFRPEDPGICWVDIRRYPAMQGFESFEIPDWRVGGAYNVPALKDSDIVNVIRKKEDAFNRWNVDCSEKWLLIVSDQSSEARSYYEEEEVFQKKYSTAFDRVFFYGRSAIRELQLKD